MYTQELWKEAYHELVSTIVRMGYPKEFGQVIARNLGSEKTMRRMNAYLHEAGPGSAEEIADEMLAIRSEINAWREKKENQQANAAYNEMLRYGLSDEKISIY